MMGLKIADRLYSGPYDMQTFRRRKNHTPVIYAIISKSGLPWDPDHHIIDIGTHPDEGMEFAAVAADHSWEPVSDGKLMLFIDFLDNRRTTIEERFSEIERVRNQLDIPGGYIPLA